MTIKRFMQPRSLSELTAALAEMTPDSKVIAGGTDLMIEIKDRDPVIPVLVSLCKVPELKGICVTETAAGQELHIGAMECHADIAASETVRKYASALAESCDHVGSRQVRNRGTIGGSLGNASVAGDMLPVLYLFHASLAVTGPDGKGRMIPVEELPAGIGRTSLGYNEIIKEIVIPVHPERNSCFVKLGGREEVTIAEISLSLSWEMRDGKIAAVEGVMGAVDRVPAELTETDGILGQGTVGTEECERLFGCLSERIAVIRKNRKRPPKLRIREGEKEFKERAVRGVVYDAVGKMLAKAGAGKTADA